MSRDPTEAGPNPTGLHALKLDRLARNVAFVSTLMESGVEFVAADMPKVNRLTVHILAAVAEEEARMISARTKAALAAAKSRGVRLGNPRLQAGTPDAARAAAAVKSAQAKARAADLATVVAEIRAAGVGTLTGVAKALTARGIPTPSGRGEWQGLHRGVGSSPHLVHPHVKGPIVSFPSHSGPVSVVSASQ